VHIQRFAAAAAALSLFGLAAPLSGASAATAPPITQAPSGLLTFVPPTVGQLGVAIGATIIGGKTISPGVNVTVPGTSLAPLSWTPPSITTPPTSATFPINGAPVH
jgi:hypothetical protein